MWYLTCVWHVCVISLQANIDLCLDLSGNNQFMNLHHFRVVTYWQKYKRAGGTNCILRTYMYCYAPKSPLIIHSRTGLTSADSCVLQTR